MRPRHICFLLLITLLTITCGGDSSAKTGGAGGKGGPGGGQGGPGGRSLEFPVEVERVRAEKVEYAVNAVGSVEAFERVEVTARVSGAIERVLFSEGQNVQRAQTLVEIEPQRYRLEVLSSQANYEKQLAAKAEAEAGLARREATNAKNTGLIPGEELQTWRTRVRTANAEVGQAAASLEQAKLNLRDAFVSAPVSGTIQTRTVQTGQYVPTGTLLATLIRRDPLLLRFQIPEQDSMRLRPGMNVRFTVNDDVNAFAAKITHVAEAASSTSRMVPVTAHVTDSERARLKPGSFAQVTIPIGGTIEAPVIPQTAIRPSERGFLAFVVDGKVARERILSLGLRTATGRVEVRQGVAPGELLVIRGAEALRDGAPVKVQLDAGT